MLAAMPGEEHSRDLPASHPGGAAGKIGVPVTRSHRVGDFPCSRQT